MENFRLREKCDDIYYLNKKLDEALKIANEKIMKYEHMQNTAGSTMMGDSGLI